jgi:hypothetical protein
MPVERPAPWLQMRKTAFIAQIRQNGGKFVHAVGALDGPAALFEFHGFPRRKAYRPTPETQLDSTRRCKDHRPLQCLAHSPLNYSSRIFGRLVPDVLLTN